MVKTKTRSTPVVEKKEVKETACGCKDCTCGDGCKCGCECRRTLLLCGTIFVSALLVAGSIIFNPCCGKSKGLPPRVESAKVVRPETNKTFSDFIAANPKLLADTLEKHYQAKAAEQAKAEPRKFDLNNLAKADEALVKQIIDDKTNYSLGNPKGKFVIIEFFDYQCGWCKRTNKGLEEAIASEDGKNIRWIAIDTPIFGEASELIARYVLAAGEQGKYADMHKAVGEATGRVDENALLEMAKKLKLNTEKLTADAKGEKISKKLEANNVFREKLNINGVPMLIVDGRINPGALIGANLDAVVKLSKDKK